ncbi:hypothetical protein LTR97_004336 [Elasticomyces elasticus]|uniref:Uncharacterized protein n=1 Tax=Elasticomyces elasticus TaxID=574655 RepID=A0AAN7VSJ3_9PEZI|nr:hypothetical protein LTR97_004336 [Elasticomyces elasticus]
MTAMQSKNYRDYFYDIGVPLWGAGYAYRMYTMSPDETSWASPLVIVLAVTYILLVAMMGLDIRRDWRRWNGPGDFS